MHHPAVEFEAIPRSRPASGAAPPAIRLQVLLYLLTMLTTFAAGCVGWRPVLLGDPEAGVADSVASHWPRGLAYSAAVLAVLSAHEAGHFVAARLHGIRATLPFFIPMPLLLTGTLGAVIGMEGSRADRRQLFDIAIAGPLAGLAVALPLLALGMRDGGGAAENVFALPPLARWMLALVRPDLPAGATIAPNPMFMAGWVGLLVTGLNMIPLSQLDGGHVSCAVFGRRSDWVGRGVLVAALAAIVIQGRYEWVLMAVLVTLMGTDHPPIRDESRPPGGVRTVLGILSFVIPIVTFMPEPLAPG